MLPGGAALSPLGELPMHALPAKGTMSGCSGRKVRCQRKSSDVSEMVVFAAGCL